MLDLGLALFLGIIAAGIGKRLLGRAGELPEHPLDALGMSTALGLGLLALACLAIGELGKLNLSGLTVLMAVATEVGLLAGLNCCGPSGRPGSRARNHALAPTR